MSTSTANGKPQRPLDPPDLPFHEAAGIFPLEEATLEDLAEDIRKHGLREPITVLDGQILDGRRRSIACAWAGVKPRYEFIETDDPVAYVKSLNLHRRQLKKGQLA